MPSLSSLIVQRQVATITEVEQAISRQVIHGGDLVTNLLEVAPGCELPLTHVLAESLGIPSVPPGRMAAPSNEVLDIVPVELTLRYSIFPLRLSQKTLVVATSEKLNSTVMNDLAYMLGVWRHDAVQRQHLTNLRRSCRRKADASGLELFGAQCHLSAGCFLRRGGRCTWRGLAAATGRDQK